MITTTDELLNASLGDYRLITMSWKDDGRNFLVLLEEPRSTGVLQLLFIWATQVRVEVDFDSDMFGAPLLWKATFRKSEDMTWKVVFDFGGAPTGGVSLCCNDVDVKALQANEGGGTD